MQARFCRARHSETLEWHDVFENGGRFRMVASRDQGVTQPIPDPGFAPTHVHYKGGLYRVIGHGKAVGDAAEMTLYRDGPGNFFIRPRAMFEEAMPDGRPRFAPFSVPACA